VWCPSPIRTGGTDRLQPRYTTRRVEISNGKNNCVLIRRVAEGAQDESDPDPDVRLVEIDFDGEVLRIRSMVMITPTRRASCRCFRLATLPRGGTRGSRLCGEERDREIQNLKVCARTRDTRFIQVWVAKVANPTSCLGIKYGALRLVLGWLRSRARLGIQCNIPDLCLC
jgi:hypothetical protein